MRAVRYYWIMAGGGGGLGRALVKVYLDLQMFPSGL
jgi:hypothetical protein